MQPTSFVKWGLFERLSRLSPAMAPALAMVAGILWTDGVEWNAWACLPLALSLLWAASLRSLVLIMGAALLGGGLHGMRIEGQREMDARLQAGPVLGSEWKVSVVESRGNWARVRCEELEAQLRLSGELPVDLLAGDKLLVNGVVYPIGKSSNPTDFDRFAWLWRQGIGGEMRAGQVQRVAGVSWRDLPYRWGQRAANWIEEQLTRGLGEEDPGRAVVVGICLGKTGALDDESLERFRRSGALHVFAVSGMHVGIVALLGWAVLRWCGIERHRLAWLLILLMFGYAWVTGFRASALRAAVMGSVLLLGWPLRRHSSAMNRLAVAACLLLMLDGHQLFGAAFQLSFAVMASILLIGPRLERALPGRHPIDEWLPRPLWTERQVFWHAVVTGSRGMLVVTVAAWLGSLFLGLIHFKMIAPGGLLASVPMVCGAFMVLSLGLLSLALGWALPFLVQLNALLAALMGGFALWLGGQPWSAYEVKANLPGSSLVVLDLGDGGCVLFGGKSPTLLDAGDRSAGAYEVIPALDYFGFWQGNLLLSHGDEDHVGGALPLLEKSPAWRVGMPMGPVRSPAIRELKRRCDASEILGWTPRPGDRLAVGEGELQMLLGGRAPASAGRADDWCAVWMWSCGKRRVLLMNDSGIAREQSLINSPPAHGVDLLILGKHAHDVSGTLALISALQPRLVVATHEAFPSEQMRQATWEDALRASGTRYLRLDRTGALKFDFQDSEFELSRWDGSRFIPLQTP